jgi:hypothetical protein
MYMYIGHASGVRSLKRMIRVRHATKKLYTLDQGWLGATTCVADVNDERNPAIV